MEKKDLIKNKIEVGCRGATRPTSISNHNIKGIDKDVKHSQETILDSSLITETILSNKVSKFPSNELSSLYDTKLVVCGDYIQVYQYKDKRRKKQNDTEDLSLTKLKVEHILENTDADSNSDNIDSSLITETIKKSETLKNNIEFKNITRSKLQCQRLAKANMQNWKTFITLTFDPKKDKTSMTNIDNANKRLHSFLVKVKRIKKDFKYICVPEFQKNGRVHYHLLTNIDINDNTLIYSQENKSQYKHIKYWNDGFTKVDNIDKDVKKIIGYISKYMTKDIDNRLFGHRRFFNSTNLNKVTESYIDSDNSKEIEYYKKIIQDKDLIYQNKYLNSYDNTQVTFLEFLKK